MATLMQSETLVCETCLYTVPPSFVRDITALAPCPECGSPLVARACDEVIGCNDPLKVAQEADAADERRYQTLSAERPEEGGDETLN